MRALFAFSWLACLAATTMAQSPPAGDPRGLVTEADRELREGRRESAILKLWSAERRLGTMSEGIDDDLLAAVRDRLAECDPLDRELRVLNRTGARKLVDLARSYQRKKWKAAALDLVVTAAALDPNPGARLRVALESELGAVAPSLPEPAGETQSAFERLKPLCIAGAWEIGPSEIQSGPLDGMGPQVLTAIEPGHADHRLSVDIELPESDAMAGLLFGVSSRDSYYICDFERWPQARAGRLTVYRWNAPDLRTLGCRDIRLEREPSDGVHTLEVWVDGRTVVAMVNGIGRLIVSAPEPPHGGVGLFVSSLSPWKEGILFRNLAISELPRKEPLETLHADESRLQALLAEVDRTEAMAAGGDPESAVRALWRLQARIVELRTADRRVQLCMAMCQALAEHDALQGRQLRVRAELAKNLVALAEKHARADRLHVALELLRHAAVWHLGTAGQALADLESRLEGVPTGEVAAEGPVPVDNAELLGWFAEDAGEHDPSGWLLDELSAMSPTLDGNTRVLLATRGSDCSGGVRVQVRVGRSARGGLAFAARDAEHFHAVVLTHEADGRMELELRSRDGAAWKTLEHRPLPLSREARSGFITLALTLAPGEILATVGLAEPVRLALDRSDLAGRFGLYAESIRGAQHVDFRNFRPPAN